MPLTLLFDLDDTLLDTNMDAFLPAYFRAFSKHLADHVDPQVMMSAMLASINLIYKSQDPGRTLLEVFDENYFTRHENNDICKIVVDLTTDNYELSKIWKKNDVLQSTEEMKLKEIVPELVMVPPEEITKLFWLNAKPIKRTSVMNMPVPRRIAEVCFMV